MTAERILVVEDDVDIARVVGRYLERDGFVVELVHDGVEGLERALNADPQLVLLDWMLPGLDGMEVLSRLRGGSDVPVIMLTARGEHDDRLQGFRVGVDDYVPKPFHPPELVARVHAVLRRSRQPQQREGFQVGELMMDVGKRHVTAAGRPVELTAREFDLLHLLASHPGRVFRRNELLDRVWGPDFIGVDRVVDVHVSKLRQKLGTASGRPFIETVRGVGYRLGEEGSA